MTVLEEAPPPQAAPRRRASATGVLGEILVTVGVLVLLFVVWQQWIDDAVSGVQMHDQAAAASREWDSQEQQGQAPPGGTADDVPVPQAPKAGQQFANLIVPRFGADYYRPIAEGVGLWTVLNRYKIGHYPSTQLPGEEGNFVVAAHRRAYGGQLHYIHTLQVGDPIYIETREGWYRYVFRNLEYVDPSAIDVLNPTPQDDTLAVTGRYLSLQTCNPYFSTAERMFAFGEFDRFFPRADGAPAELAGTIGG